MVGLEILGLRIPPGISLILCRAKKSSPWSYVRCNTGAPPCIALRGSDLDEWQQGMLFQRLLQNKPYRSYCDWLVLVFQACRGRNVWQE